MEIHLNATDRTTAYFDDVVNRAITAHAVLRQPVDYAQPNACHDNCEHFALGQSEYQIVRGWLVVGGHWLIPHSVVRHISSSELRDITPGADDSVGIPFVEHRGTEQDFATLRIGRDGGWLHPPINPVL